MPPARITAALTAIVAVPIPLSCVQLVVRLLFERDEFVAYNGILRLPGESLVEAAVTAVAWTLAITWALTILSGRYAQPARAALRFLPLGLAALAAAVGAFLAIFFGFGALASNMGDAFWIPLALAVIPLSYIIVRVGLALPVAVLDDVGPGPAFAQSWRLAQGRTIGLSLIFAAGVILPAVLAGLAIDWLGSSAVALTWAGRQIILTVVAVLQTLTLLAAWRIAVNRPLPVLSVEYRAESAWRSRWRCSSLPVSPS
jgi:hypothetical protein